MEYKDLERINKKISTVDIKGKDYATVNARVLGFRELMPTGTIETKLIHMEAGTVVFQAIIKDSEGKVLATGYAEEIENSSFINKTSYIENCETSAVGRALGFLGIGSETSIASAEEVTIAIKKQENNIERPKYATEEQKQKIIDLYQEKELVARLKVPAERILIRLNTVTEEEAKKLIMLKEKKDE